VTPQSHFMVVAPIEPGREAALRGLLATLNAQPGVADPRNALLPFGQFEQLHFARLAMLEDETLGDLEAHGLARPQLPSYLAFMGDCDGPGRECLAGIAARAGPGLREIFSHCQSFGRDADLMAWMLTHDTPPAARYVNWLGRTVRQIREEDALHRALAARVPRAPVDGAAAQRVRRELVEFVRAEQGAGRLALTPPEPTPPAWRVATLAHLIGVPLLGLLLLPVLIVLSPLLLVALRIHETRDPEISPRPDRQALHRLQALEDRDITNQYTALGLVKPGPFRRWLLTALLVLVDYAARHVFTRGHLGRVQTIHFARWVFIDDKQRVVFTSNYDGSHQAYMDDFINKVAWGLNLLFSNGVGWPRTRWLIKGGARIEQSFKRYQRRHQLPTEVWYKAYPGLALVDLKRNQRIREGLEQASMSDAQALAWLRLL
jgi:hypothetical protein